ncbi:MAG: T9SS type A sorting domain-containing protein [Bacteroidia bacterium]
MADYIRIIDMQGKLVYEVQNTDGGGLKLDISKYTKGIYFVLAKIGDTLEKQKLMVE